MPVRKLDYSSARVSILFKSGVPGKYRGDDYKDAPLFSIPLQEQEEI